LSRRDEPRGVTGKIGELNDQASYPQECVGSRLLVVGHGK
jgi:hypothetical protein